MVSIVLNEFRVRDSSVSEILVIVLRIRHDSFKHTLVETELSSDGRLYGLVECERDCQ